MAKDEPPSSDEILELQDKIIWALDQAGIKPDGETAIALTSLGCIMLCEKSIDPKKTMSHIKELAEQTAIRFTELSKERKLHRDTVHSSPHMLVDRYMAEGTDIVETCGNDMHCPTCGIDMENGPLGNFAILRGKPRGGARNTDPKILRTDYIYCAQGDHALRPEGRNLVPIDWSDVEPWVFEAVREAKKENTL